ncbi:helix-turn-helix domain-containing protein [Glutamicibacter ardleyensis]|uniref:helix-turn-helix domain-containing protein n=1 Tax=Glutamicibacter ardleyensis TaxID=225894 RepID=UPI003FD1EAC0
MAKALSEADRKRIRALHGEGLSRNGIAREIGCSPGTVSNVCKEFDLSFDRSNTENATRAKVIDNKAVRAAIASDTLAATQGLASIIQGRINRGLEDESFRDLATVFGILVDKHGVLVKMDQSSEEHSAVDEWLNHITGGEQ